MSLTIDRKTLHQAIDHLPESTLSELAAFIALLQAKIEETDPHTDWPPHFFDIVIGGWQGAPLERPAQGILEERDALI